MSYLPGFRASLVEAARREYAGAPAPQAQGDRRRRLTKGGLATALASAIAVAVAVVAVVGLGHRRPSAPSAAAPAPPTRIDLRRSATAALGQLVLPPGAVVSGLVRGTPIELWSVSDQLRIQGHVDVYRIWRIHERPDRLITFIAAHRQPGWLGGMNGSSETASSGGPAVVQQATGVIALPATGNGIWRELALNAVRLADGGTGLRVDSEAGWLPLRPLSTRIPAGVTQIQLYWGKRGRGQHLSERITNLQSVKTLVSMFNSLPAARAGTSTCASAPDGHIKFTFEGAGRTFPLAVATWAPPCQNLRLSVGGRTSVPVMAGSPTMPEGAQIIEAIVPFLRARRLSGSTTTVNSSNGCAITTPQSSATSPSAPGAGGGSCTSGSHSTTSASSH